MTEGASIPAAARSSRPEPDIGCGTTWRAAGSAAWAFVLLAGPTLASGAPVDFTPLEQTVLDEMREIHAPGASIAIVRGDEIVYSRGFGVANLETGTPVTPDTLFRVGSITKIFTAATLVSLAERRALRLDQAIGELIPGLPPRLARLTAHQLLTHTSGLRDEAPAFGRHDPEALGRTIRAWTDSYAFLEPGVVMSYSNPGMALAGFLVEQLASRPFDRVVEAGLLAPLGMTRTTFRPTVAMTYPIAQGHATPDGVSWRVVRPYPDNAGFWPAGFLFSTALDLSRFAIAFMSCGLLEGRQVLQPTVIERLSVGRADIPSAPRSLADARYGYGVTTGILRGARVIRHAGAIEGFGAMLTMVPAARVAVVTLVNRTGGQLERTVEEALDLLVPLEPVSPDGPEDGTDDTDVPPPTAEELARYAGTYVNTATIELAVEQDTLVLRLRTRQGGVELETQSAAHKVGRRRFRVQLTPTGPPEEFVLLPREDETGPAAPAARDDQEIAFLHMRARAFSRRVTTQPVPDGLRAGARVSTTPGRPDTPR